MAYTKKAVDVFAPTDAGGNIRRVNTGETQIWGTEVEREIALAVAGESEADFEYLEGLVETEEAARIAADLLKASIAQLDAETAARVAAILAEATTRAAEDGWQLNRLDAQPAKVLHTFWKHVIADLITGIVHFGVDRNGRSHLLRPDETPLLNAIFQKVLLAGRDGAVALGLRKTGALDVGPYSYAPLLHSKYADVTAKRGLTIDAVDRHGVSLIRRQFEIYADGQVYVRAGGRTIQVTNEPDLYFRTASYADGLIRLIRSDDYCMEVAIQGRHSDIDAAVTKVRDFPTYGQSNSVGSAAGSVLSPTVVRPGFALMHQRGPRPYGTDQNYPSSLVKAPIDFFRDVVNAYEMRFGGSGETGLASLLFALTGNTFPPTEAALGACLGFGSADYNQIKKGTSPFDNFVARAERLRLFLAALGIDYEMTAAPYQHGEYSMGFSAAAKIADMTALQADITALASRLNALPTETGGTKKTQVPLVYAQTSTFPHYSVTSNPGSPLGELQANIDDPSKFLCVGPTYPYAHAVDGAHILATGQHIIGALRAKAIKTWIDGGTWKPLHFTAAVRTGQNIDLTAAVPGGKKLTLDAINVSNPGNFGLAWNDAGDGNAPTISSINIRGGETWTSRAIHDNAWRSIATNPAGVAVAVASDNASGLGQLARSIDGGVTWTPQAAATAQGWQEVVWAEALGLFVAVAGDGNSVTRAMTSPDGITWTSRTTPNGSYAWYGLCWSPELSLLVAVAGSGHAMTSPDGVTWTLRTPPALNDWRSVCWAKALGLFVAVGRTGTGNRIITSPDGITWTARTNPENNEWLGVAWLETKGILVAVASSGTNRVMRSTDGINWTAHASSSQTNWIGVTASEELGLFVATADAGTTANVMTSPDGSTWTGRTGASVSNWYQLVWSKAFMRFIAIALSGSSGLRVMTSESLNNVLIRLSTTPTGTAQKILVALNGSDGDDPGPTSGARCNFRSNDTALDRLSNPLHDWACHQSIDVTT